jgi:hypothetical protein
MSSHVEKIQQSQQQVHHNIGQHLDEERAKLDEMKRSEIQDMDEANQTDPTDPEGGPKRKQVRARKKKLSDEEKDTAAETQAKSNDGIHGSKIDVVI